MPSHGHKEERDPSEWDEQRWPTDVGIIGMEIYFPMYYVDQDELEDHDQVSKGKYTIGLGQKAMGFTGDREDVNSFCLTVVQKLMDKYNVRPSEIGRIDVGTETLLDKSKSVKTVLMQLFEESGNTEIEGIDSTNACYGGTSALFNAVNWIESSSWDGRLALAVMGDIAVYAAGNARSTGGAGAIALLIGPNAPLVIDRGLKGTHMQHSYDFYKPDMVSEYPVVDGKLTIKCYLTALDRCYERYRTKFERRIGSFSLSELDFFVFHTPFCKMVQKSVARCYFNDYLHCEADCGSAAESLTKYRDCTLEETIHDEKLMKDVERASVQASMEVFMSKTKPSLLVAEQVGNMYTPSLYGSLASLLVCEEEKNLLGKRVGLFSYGSGLAASIFSLTICPNQKSLAGLRNIRESLMDLPTRLKNRIKVRPEEFVAMLKHREETHHLPSYTPSGSVDHIAPGAFFLELIDDKFRRFYKRRPCLPVEELITENGVLNGRYGTP